MARPKKSQEFTLERENAAALALATNPETDVSPSTIARLEAVALCVAEEMGFRLLPRGRQLRATPETVRHILEAIGNGLTVEESVIMAGVAPRAVTKWREANAGLEALFRQAELAEKAKLLALMQSHAKRDSKAANWLLERRHSMESRNRTEITGANGGPIHALTIHRELLASLAKGPVIDVQVSKVAGKG